MTPREAAVVVLAAGGVFFSLVAAVGLLRLPDLYTRAHATSKNDTLGAGLGLAAVALALSPGAGTLKTAFLLAFVLVTNPVGAHAVSRSAYRQGVVPWTAPGDDRTDAAGTDADGDDRDATARADPEDDP